MKTKQLLALVIPTVIAAVPGLVLAQQEPLTSNVPANIRAMIEQSQATNGFESMARMQVDAQFGGFLNTLNSDPRKRTQVENALIKVISDRAELSAQVARGQGNAVELETHASYAYLRGQLAPLLSRAELQRLDDEQGTVARRNLRQNYAEQLERTAPDMSEASETMVLDSLVDHMLFRRENAEQRNQLTPDEVVNQQLMSLRDAREELEPKLSGVELDQFNTFMNQIRSNLFLNQSMYDSVQ